LRKRQFFAENCRKNCDRNIDPWGRYYDRNFLRFSSIFWCFP
jgi:hypothetical protein